MSTRATYPPKRRRLRTRVIAALTTVALAVTGLVAAPAVSAAQAPYGAPDEIAAKYYEALLRHTNWVETVWDEAKGTYLFNDFNFAVVMGNAVLLNHGEYDEELAGVSEAELRSKTIATIEYYASRNRNVNPTGTQDLWGKKMFWDSTFQSYFLMAGKLMWDELSAQTQQHLTMIAREQTRYTVGLDMQDEPLSGSWTARWPEGEYNRDTALEEVGVYTQSIAPGVAWAKDDPENAAWEAQLNVWLRNAAGQPTADKANPAVVGGAPISDNVMQNIHDTYLVENHNSFGPHYQQDIWRSGARNAIHFLLNDLPVPEAMIKQPNSAELWRSIEMVMSDQGEPLMPMVSDREFLYGRNLLPLAFVGQVLRNPTAVRAEAQLADAFEAYQNYEPVYRLTKFNGEPKYEPEARAELGISYMLHVLAAESDEGPVEPADYSTWLADVSGVRDFGANPGLVAQQTSEAWGASVTRAGFVKFPWSPKHDSWLVAISGSSTSLYPRLNDTVLDRAVKVYNKSSDGFEGTATTVTTNQGRVSMTTLPTGSAVYAATGQPATETSVTIRSLDMSGYNGLDGTRSYTGAEGTTVVDNGLVIPKDAADNSAWRSHDLDFDPVEARYVRMQGIRGNAQYGYSMYKFHVYGVGTATDVAKGKPATASSAAPNNPASYVTNNTASQRWAVSTADRPRGDSWIQVDLGEPTMIDKARLAWENSAGEVYDLQVSNNGTDWQTVAHYDVVDRSDEIQLTPVGAEQPAPVTARYIRMMGERPHAQYGYSAFYFRALDANGIDLAAGKPATASSHDGNYVPSNVTSNDPRSRWAVATSDRGRTDSWIQIDLGEEHSIAEAVLGWEMSPKRYRIETSVDGTNWQTTGSYEYTGDRHAQTDGGWMNVEGKGGYVVRGSDDPITVTRFNPTQYRLNLTGDNGDETRVVEMVPGDATRTAAQAAVETPASSDPSVVANYVDGYLVVNNLTDEDRDVTLTIANDDDATPLFQGTQTATSTETVLEVSAPAASTQVFAPRASVELEAGQTLNATLTDARSVQISSASGTFTAGITNLETGVTTNIETSDALVAVAARFASARPFPIADFALGSLTFPASVLPTGMTSPHNAVDGDSATSWSPGPDGRMVVDLGAAKEIGQVIAAWEAEGSPAATIETSADGLTFTTLGALEQGAERASVSGPVTARYVAIKTAWAPGDPELTSLQVLPVGGVDSEIAAHESGAEFNASSSTVFPGEDANLSVSLPLDATGSVIFRDGTNVLATVPVTAGSASLDLTDLSLGEHEFTIEYTGDAHYRGATSEVIKINVTLRDAAIVLTADKSNVTEGDDVLLTAQVATEATGTVEFFDGATSVGVEPVANGFASITARALTKGTHTFTAVYSGDGVFGPVTSAAVTVVAEPEVVDPEPTPDPAVSAATLSAGSQIWQAKPGKRITVRAVVSNTTSGTVTFRSGARVLGSAPVVKSGSQYVASVTLPAKFAVGTYAGVTAVLATGGKTYTTVNTAAKFTVVKTKPKKVKVKTKKYRVGTAAKIKVKVGKLTNGKKAVGKVRLVVGKKQVRTVKLTKKKNGKVTVKLPRRVTKAGKTLRVRAVFLPKPKQKVGVAKVKSTRVKVKAQR